MQTLRITAGDTAPIQCSYPGNITGYTITLLIGAVSKTATITDAANGLFTFTRTGSEYAEGSYDSALVLTSSSGSETTDPFVTIVAGRPS